MGMYENQYLGIYIELEYKDETIDNVVRVCPNGHELSNPKVKFCSECGTEIIEENKPIRQSISYYDLVDDGLLPVDIDDFSVINIDSSDKTWLVQNLRKGEYGMFLDDANYGAYSLSMNTGEMLSRFHVEFEGLLLTLRQYCKSVKVDYGLIKYYN